MTTDFEKNDPPKDELQEPWTRTEVALAVVFWVLVVLAAIGVVVAICAPVTP